MALMDSLSSSLYKEQPQQNQYLTGSPFTQPDANTGWMSGGSAESTGYNGPSVSNISSTQPNPPSQVSNGTMLGSIAAGNSTPSQPQRTFMNNWQPQTNNAPPGFDATKWADQSLGTSNKYIVGRMMASGSSIEDAARAVGARVIGPDKIQYPDGFIADVIYDYGGPNQRLQYTDVTPNSSMIGNGQMPGNSMFGQMQGNQQQQDPFSMNNLLNQIWQMMQSQRQMSAQNPFASQNFGNNYQMNTQPQFDMSSIGVQSPMNGGSVLGMNPNYRY